MPRLTSLARWIFTAAVSPNAAQLRYAEHFSCWWVFISKNAPVNEPVYQFMDKKRSEGKPYKVYMMASANKFLRIYYASVKAYLDALDEA